MMTEWMTWIRDWLDKKLLPSNTEELIFRITFGCVNMGLLRDHYVLLAGVPGTCGDIRLGGTVAPVFSYLVFYKPKMEFVRVIVKLCKPNTILFTAYIDGNDPNTNGKELPVVEQFKEPFFKVAAHLSRYFPYGANPPAVKLEHFINDVKQEVLIHGSI